MKSMCGFAICIPFVFALEQILYIAISA